MSRQWRIEYSGCVYHVMSRGNGRQDIFHTDRDRVVFIDYLRELSERFDIDIVAYVLMDNHYHLLLKTNAANLSKAMQWFGTCYTKSFNINNKTGGHLFQGRFKSLVVEKNDYLLRLSCYIHRNPLRAGFVERLSDYKWSSYPVYAYGRKKPEWLKTGLIMDQLSCDNLNKSYRNMTQAYSDETNRVWDDVKHGLIYGGQNFIDDIRTRFLGDKKVNELPQHNSLLRALDPLTILNVASKYLDIDIESFRNSKRINDKEKDKRDLLIYLLRQTGRFSNDEIGGFFGLTYSAVSSRCKVIGHRISKDKELEKKYFVLKSQIQA